MTPPTPLSPTDLQAYLDEHAIPGEIIQLEIPTLTVEAAAQALGVETGQIVKSVLFLVRGEAVMTITCGTGYVERRAVAARYNVGRKRVKLADAEAVLAHTGYEVGAVPPFGYPQPLPTLLDPGVLENDEVYAGGGGGNAMTRLNPQDILRITQAEVLDLHNRPENV